MEHKPKRTKRPCRICRKWFSPDNRLGDRQKTCGDKECQSKWHAKKCAEWNKKNRSYFQAIYLSRKLQVTQPLSIPADRDAALSNPDKICLVNPPSSRFAPKLPRDVIQEVIGVQHLVIIEYVQHLVIIEYVAQLLLNSFKEVMRAQPIEIKGKMNQIPCEWCLRSDRPDRVP